jgi:uncharacterized protein YecA (UPF0149 family)
MMRMLAISSPFLRWHTNDPDPEMRPYDKPVTPELREKLLIGAAAGVMKIYRYFREQRLRTAPALRTGSGDRSPTKVGRNDPCPCGSGRKYKHCCGKVTLH